MSFWWQFHGTVDLHGFAITQKGDHPLGGHLRPCLLASQRASAPLLDSVLSTGLSCDLSTSAPGTFGKRKENEMRRALFLAAMVCVAGLIAKAQDPVKVDPKQFKVEFENARVRVLRVNIGAHEKVPMHEHPANVVVFLTAAHVKFTFPDGKTEETHGKAGQAVWGAGEKHEAENVGDKPMEVIQIELKAKPAAAKPPAEKKKG